MSKEQGERFQDAVVSPASKPKKLCRALWEWALELLGLENFEKYIRTEAKGLKDGWHLFIFIALALMGFTAFITWKIRGKAGDAATSQNGFLENPRLLNKDQRQILLDELKKVPAGAVGGIVHPENDEFAIELAAQIAKIFTDAKIDGIEAKYSYTDRGKLTRGVWFIVKDTINPPRQLTGIRSAFKAIGFDAPVYADPRMEEPSFIYVEIGRSR